MFLMAIFPCENFFLNLNLSRARMTGATRSRLALAACLRGRARSVLDGIAEIGSVTFTELKSKLELRFGEGHSAQSCYFQFTNRRQKFGEDFVTLGTDLKRLVRLAYPECSLEVREKIACAQFISALTDGFIKHTL